MDYYQKGIELVKKNRGKFEVVSKVTVKDLEDLSVAYTPGVAGPTLKVKENPQLAYSYTIKGSFVPVVTDGSAVLGLGNIGPEAAMVVMEGKAILLKAFAEIDAIPLCLGTLDVDEIVRTIKILEPTFGGIFLEDISAPRCFEVEERLRQELSIPVFHDDQHGTAIATAAALWNALKVVKKSINEIRVVINGAGASGYETARLLMTMGVRYMVVCDTSGAIYLGRPGGMNKYKRRLAQATNPWKIKTLEEAMVGADVFIGLSGPGVLNEKMVRSMSKDPIIFAMSNPIPEIFPDEAKEYGAKVVGTGRSDFKNQVNNLLAFPGVMRGALDVRAKTINDEMKIAAAKAIAGYVRDSELDPDHVTPCALEKELAFVVARAVAKAARDSGVARAI
ncbi:malic protein NAD-binding protein [Desulfofundulus kuznetsovii DSM 6115]|uniref:Malic protein NAD-binding protein n=1 Tax=Desulfofundulus kuznetsovii (strain DSM 6115 / VKM B-1805 / 17) TaxID=760568 RepID=A0AAU8Q006_DESK7|nr:malic protein NAD-binding protein [Desulfofundulus kuznetsovii DSM 6115]